jgi:hypothetical protein
MKKLLLCSSFFALSYASVNAQVAFSASDLTGFQDMTVVDADGDSSAWGVYDFMTANNGNPLGTSFDSQGELLASFSYDNATQTALTPDNWLITPALNLSGYSSAAVYWGRASVDPNYAAENYSVYVVTAADPTALLTALTTATPVFTETISTGDEWLEKSVSINSFAGQNNVYVAFRHHACTDMFLLTLDDIEVGANVSVEEKFVNVSLYPNPANDVLNITVDEQVELINVVSLDGKIVISENVAGSSNVLNVADLTSGVYVVEVFGSEGLMTRTNFIKK